jgi:hypothetical protein
MPQAVEIVGGRLADRGIETAFALAGGQHIPQAEAVREQAIVVSSNTRPRL